ncbi:rhamnulokinase family protein [Nocardioides sp. KR10-350]|uniref:rhamnulokinase n=1 Tax=Nocardioides cheoyonin TaxID=3156615 RepID=UPI0032B3225A
MSARTVAAVDLGAESGRVAAVSFDGERLELEVVHRFPHTTRVEDGILRWDIDTLWRGVRDGLALLDARETPVDAVGVDAWGVDYGLFGRDGRLVDTPTCYRDARNVGAMRQALTLVAPAELYAATGVQLIPINTLFSLFSDVRDHPGRIAAADSLLMMPDVFHHLLSGSTATEYTAASTTGALDMRTGTWAWDVLDRLGIPSRILPEVVAPGTDVGPLRSSYAGALAGARVIVPPAHDTASAVVGTPFRQPGELFVSSGTWSLVGVERGDAVVTDGSRRANLTNEGGYAGTIRLLRNVMGLWILQNCRRQWASEGVELDYPQIAALAAQEPGLASIVNPDAEVFLAPGDMPARIRDYCRATGQPVPDGVGAVARCVIDSLALGYRSVAEDIARVTGTPPPAIGIVGGGSSHALLSQLTADATGLPVRCGPVEATALGNAAVQLAALGELGGLDDIRRVIAASTRLAEHEPRPGGDWDAAADRFAELVHADLAATGLAGAAPA